MKRQSKSALRVAALCLEVGVLLTSLACGRIDLGPRLESEPASDDERPENDPPPQFTLGPPTTRVEFGPDRGTPNGGSPLGGSPLGGIDVAAPLDGPDASVADAAPGPSADHIDAGVDAEAP